MTGTMTTDRNGPTGWWAHTHAEYADGERPLNAFVGLMGAYGGLVGVLGTIVLKRGAWPPPKLSAGDLALYGVATHKLARLLAKDPVTSPLRAPFVRFQGQSGEAELAEEVRGTGLQKAIGELVTCPFCLGQWVATGFTFGHVVAPRLTRIAAAVFAELTLADFLQLGFAAAQQGQAQVGS